MKLQILSDLHIDSYERRGQPIGAIPKTDADVILVAGDTANSDKGMVWLQQQAISLDKPILTIAGNHEYFNEDVLTFDATLASWDNFTDVNNDVDASTNALPNKTANYNYGQGVRVLQCQAVDYEEVRILGCTLWTDYEYQRTPDTIPQALKFMRDYQQIRAGEALFSPEVSMQLHAKQRAWLKSALQTAHDEQKTVVVMTHHSVSPLSVSKKYAHLPSNAAFVTDLSHWMHAAWAPKLWVHGHTHEAFDYRLGNTRVVVNPRAYPGEVSSTELEFAWQKVVEI